MQVTSRKSLQLALLFSILYFGVGCAVKNVYHEYPYQYTPDQGQAVDEFTISWMVGGYSYSDSVLTSGLFIDFFEGPLRVTPMDSGSEIWYKKDLFTNPIDNKMYALNSVAEYDSGTETERFNLTISHTENDTSVITSSGTMEDISFQYEENNYRLLQRNIWEGKTEVTDEGKYTAIHHYPDGIYWTLYLNNREIGLLVQGIRIIDSSGEEFTYGEKYTFVLSEYITWVNRAELVTTLIGYLAYSDIEYYFQNCDFNYAETSYGCPPSVIKL